MSNNELIQKILDWAFINKHEELEWYFSDSSGMCIDSYDLEEYLESLKTKE